MDTQLQEKLLDAQDRISELEEINEHQAAELSYLRTQVSLHSSSSSSSSSTLLARNAELEKQNNELRIILSSETSASRLKSEKRQVAMEWSERLIMMQEELERAERGRREVERELEGERRERKRLEEEVLGMRDCGEESVLVEEREGKKKKKMGMKKGYAGLSLLSTESPVSAYSLNQSKD